MKEKELEEVVKTTVGGYNEWGYITVCANEGLNREDAIEFGEALGIEMVTDIKYK